MISATNVDQILGVHTALPVIGLLTTWLLTFSIHKNKFVFLMKISFSQMMKSGHPIFNLPLYFRSNRLSSLYGSSSIVPKGSSARSITSSRSSKSRNKLKLYRPRSSCSIPGKAKWAETGVKWALYWLYSFNKFLIINRVHYDFTISKLHRGPARFYSVNDQTVLGLSDKSVFRVATSWSISNKNLFKYG